RRGRRRRIGWRYDHSPDRARDANAIPTGVRQPQPRSRQYRCEVQSVPEDARVGEPVVCADGSGSPRSRDTGDQPRLLVLRSPARASRATSTAGGADGTGVTGRAGSGSLSGMTGPVVGSAGVDWSSDGAGGVSRFTKGAGGGG